MEMLDANEIFEKGKRDGFISIYLDTPAEVVGMVKDYNEEMGVCRVNRKKMKNLESAFVLINPVLSLIFYLMALIEAHNILISSIIIVLFLAIYVIFVFFKKNFLVVSVAAAVLLAVDLRLFILLAADLAIAVLHMNINAELRSHDGYIAFNDIRMINTGEVSSKQDGSGTD